MKSPSWYLHSHTSNYFKKSYFLLCGSEFNTEYFNDMKRSFENYWTRRNGWDCTEVSITMRNLNNVNDCEYPFVRYLCMKKSFKSPRWTFEHAKSINHLALDFLKRDTISNISFWENFTNLVSVCIFQSEFNDDMLMTISKLLLLNSLLHKCKMGNYLLRIAKISTIKNFHLSMCTQAEKIMPPLQCRQLKLDSICGGNSVDLSDCAQLSHLQVSPAIQTWHF
jgi:hypothetical protein